MIRAVAAILICLALAGLWWHGFKRGEAADKQRSDLVISGMVNDAQARLSSANALIKQQTDALQATKERAERDLQSEKARNERRLADAMATSDLVRQQLADFARGDGADQDSAAACRSDASSLGDVLAVALSAHGVCSGHAEAEAANARSLLNAWPVVK